MTFLANLDLYIDMNNIFSRLSSLRKITDKNQEEDFLTEIFAFVLEKDKEILKSFLLTFEIIKDLEKIDIKSVKTQHSIRKLADYEQETSSRIDLAIFLKNHSIFIENKVNSNAGENQLKKYAEHLDSLECQNKTLIFLTKNFEKISESDIRENCKNSTQISIISIKWYQVYGFLKENVSNSIIVEELLNYLENMGINLATQFNPTDLTTMINMSKILKMMERTIYGKVKDVFFEELGLKYKQKYPEIQVREHNRYVYVHEGNGIHFTLGFYFNSHNNNDYPRIGIEVWRDPKSDNFQELSKLMSQVLIENTTWKSWNNIDNPTIWAQIFIDKSIVDFLKNENHTVNIENYLIECIKEFSKIKNKFQKYL